MDDQRTTHHARRNTDYASRIAQYPAVQLLAARAADSRPDFSVSGDNAAAVAEICRHLDGLPLALELAAARVRVLPPQAMLRHLKGDDGHTGSSLQVLTGGARDLPRRQGGPTVSSGRATLP